MNIGTGAFDALTAQVAEMSERVRELAPRDIAGEHLFAAGFAAGEATARKAMFGRSAQASRPAALRPSHLRVVSEGAS